MVKMYEPIREALKYFLFIREAVNFKLFIMEEALQLEDATREMLKSWGYDKSADSIKFQMKYYSIPKMEKTAEDFSWAIWEMVDSWRRYIETIKAKTE